MDHFTREMLGRSGIFLPHVDMLYFSFILAVVFLPPDFIIYLSLVFFLASPVLGLLLRE